MKQTIQVKLDHEDVADLKKTAEANGHTVSSILRFIVKKYLTMVKKEGQDAKKRIA